MIHLSIYRLIYLSTLYSIYQLVSQISIKNNLQLDTLWIFEISKYLTVCTSIYLILSTLHLHTFKDHNGGLSAWLGSVLRVTESGLAASHWPSLSYLWSQVLYWARTAVTSSANTATRPAITLSTADWSMFYCCYYLPTFLYFK